MNKRKLIRKLTIPAAAIAIVSLGILLALIPINNAQYENHKEEFKKYMNTFMSQNTQYVKEIAAKIKSLQPDAVLIGELQSEYLVEHQKSDQPKKYLWMSASTGEFVFGVPSAVFQKVNSAFDKYQERIKADEFYRDRNDFLTRLIEKADRIDFSEFERVNPENRFEDGLRFYRGNDDWELIQPVTTSFSTPVYDSNGKPIGELHMKVDDAVNIEKYANENRFQRSDFLQTLHVLAIIFLSISGIFLWFLLPTWVYIDAEERDVKTPGIWAFLALTSLFFGLTIYLITRPASLKSFNCPKCDGELNGTRSYCPHCGYDLSNNFCQQCQYPIKPEWKFCPNCRSESKKNDAHEAEHSDIIVS